ncbi:malonate decarboxylase subunit alpha [Oscillibacter sp. MSJ-2]|uniref:Malonate decarboxylase subunit alpha n=1 Tax=Dysosmobacter acutus TaxID=2841504 RepID=A0ABS6FD17_9FIRM|nr:malonate decarboxylase subunit alpha [Dysosmobacter acutus]MBU5628047.1 malonate decarboxylase subunit alpha [Dysosmobacter acutus]
MSKEITAQEAASLIRDHMTVAVGGFGSYSSPDALLQATADRYEQEGHPKNLTIVTGVSPGDFQKENGAGLSRLKAEGLLSTLIAGHLGNSPEISAIVGENRAAGYLLPLGVVMHLLRAIAGKEPGVLTSVGLGTFADPRHEGCKANDLAKRQDRDIVELISICGQEYLFYPAFPIDCCFIRGTYADTAGNISMRHEALDEAQLQMAAAVHNNGGIVIVQVEDIVETGNLPAREVRIPRAMVDYVVKAESKFHMQYYANAGYHPEMTGELRCPTDAISSMPLDVRKVIARRGAMELRPNCLINLGIGLPSGVGTIANEEGIADQATLSLESGVFGGVPVPGKGFGGAINPEAICNAPDTFDFYNGGILDMTFLGAAEVDVHGNVNVSKFGTRCTGPGGFINISQNTPRVFFMMNFTSGMSDILVEDGKLKILQDGTGIKFVEQVQQITFSGDHAVKTGQQITYITERAVFQLTKQGLLLTEIAPGIDLERDILRRMNFRPIVSETLRSMDSRIFSSEVMGLQQSEK